MIKANDFRIGNKVIQGKRLCEIAAISGIKYSFGQQDVDLYFYDRKKIERHSVTSLKLIETTEEWLLNAGFEKTDKYWSFTNDLKFLIELDIEDNYCLRVKLSKYLSAFICQVDFIHLLQNAMFVLRGEELVFSTEP